MSGSNFMKTAAGKRFIIDPLKAHPGYRQTFLKNLKATSMPTFNVSIPKEKAKDFTELGFNVGDLVYVFRGPAKGTFTKLVSFKVEDQTFMIEGGPSTKHILPKEYWVEEQSSFMIELKNFVSTKDIKLASKIKLDDGTVKSIVADRVVMRGTYFDDRYKRVLPRRLVKDHEHIEIPWPAPAPVKDDALCTESSVALEKTYQIKSLVQPPIPTDALSGIRNSHSRWRRGELTERDVRRATPPKMPLSDDKKAFYKELDEKRAKGFKKLSPEVEEMIGQKVAAKLNSIDNVHLRAHLEELSKVNNPDLKNTLKKIKD